MISDHPLRYALANELHARPFPALSAPSFAAYIAIKREADAARRDRDLDRAHLIALLDRFGAAHPQPDATHYFATIGKHQLKWESHAEFVTYTIFGQGNAARPFDPARFDVFPADWLAEAPGVRVTSALIRIEAWKSDAQARALIDEWFVPESLAAANVLDEHALIASDFRIDAGGHMRMALFARPACGQRRIGRVVQRLCEIETYKAMSMLGLMRVRDLSPQMGRLDVRLSALVEAMSAPNQSSISQPDAALAELLTISAELEHLATRSSFRFGATGAYEAIVTARVAALREARFEGRQTFAEFMSRRYDPAMRTVKSSERQLKDLGERAMRAADLLRTRVDVERSAENQALLASMDKRADLQLRLQRTVEGLSVVAISYYAVSLAAYLAYPMTEVLHLSKGKLTAALVLPVVGIVWLAMHRIKRGIER
ncbi:MAG: putative membrane-anchored protein [Halocynthiibacter sp.]|jgi:uncharacterized membrane-anchored protein